MPIRQFWQIMAVCAALSLKEEGAATSLRRIDYKMEPQMNRCEVSLNLCNNLNDQIFRIRDRLFDPPTRQLLEMFIAGLSELKSIFENLRNSDFNEICEDLKQILLMINTGKRKVNDLIRESILMTLGLMYRSAINNESCQQEIEDLAVLIHGLKLGISAGFHVTDNRIHANDQEQITFFGAQNAAVDGYVRKEVLTRDPVQPLRMLIVDDDFNSRLLIQEIVSDLGICHIACNGEEAVNAFRAAHERDQPYHVIFMDIMMPIMDGHQALQQIRAFEHMHKKQGNDVFVFMVTAVDSHDNVCKAFFQGYCSDYIIKPVSVSKIMHKLYENKLTAEIPPAF
ncbi:MAG: response regulator [Magnetococcales bacterium]|nr:response regulator [Magnetococcales bacterium]